MSEYGFDTLSDKQVKERIRFLSDKLEALYEKMSPMIKEFELVSDELNYFLENASNEK